MAGRMTIADANTMIDEMMMLSMAVVCQASTHKPPARLPTAHCPVLIVTAARAAKTITTVVKKGVTITSSQRTQVICFALSKEYQS